MERFGPVEHEFRVSRRFLFTWIYFFGFLAVLGAALLLMGVRENAAAGSGWALGSSGLVLCPPALLLMAAAMRARRRRVTLHRDGIVVDDPVSAVLPRHHGDRPAVVAPGVSGLLWADLSEATTWQYAGCEFPFRVKLVGGVGAVCVELEPYSRSELLAKTLLGIIEERRVPLRTEWEERPDPAA